jgi:ParB/RepB/Spo0J family partition protein
MEGSRHKEKGTLEDSIKSSIVVPTGELKTLTIPEILPSRSNPRLLFDEEPLRDLKESIGLNGVLVPLTVYPLKGQNKFGILDGERRYQCCVELEKEGKSISIPANVVHPPSKLAGLLYMFNIHNFRESWELMPTAIGLSVVIKELKLKEKDNEKLANITGLSLPQVERCMKLLDFPKRFQDMSLDPDQKTRVPSNFWIEALPVLNLYEEVLPRLYEKLTRDGITDKLVVKYRNKKIKSVLHFRRIMESYTTADTEEKRQPVVRRLEKFITDPDLETRRAFDEFVVDNWRIQGSISACDEFMKQLGRAKLEYVAEKDELVESLKRVSKYVEDLLEKLKGGDQPGNPEAPEAKK